MSRKLATVRAWARTTIRRAGAAIAPRARLVRAVLRGSARRWRTAATDRRVRAVLRGSARRWRGALPWLRRAWAVVVALRWLLAPPAAAAAAYGLWRFLSWQLPTGPAGGPAFFAQRREFLTLYFGILAGLVAGFGVWLTWRRVAATEETVRVAQEGQITERFTRAVDQLGDDKLVLRLGAIYALERIAGDSERDHWNIMELLIAFVRENAAWKDGTPVPTMVGTRPRADIQAILTVIGRRPEQRRKKEPHPLNLRSTDLRGAGLVGAHLEGAYLMDAHLEGAGLSLAHLEGAHLWGARLEGAGLMGAHLEGAYLSQASLEGADLSQASLEGASLWRAHLEGVSLIEAHLEGASLIEAHLEGAYLGDAHLEGAYLGDAHLEGADLTGATGLTLEQVNQAYLDAATQLPDYLPRGQVKGRQG